MTDGNDERRSYVRYRLERADESLTAADVLATAGLWNRCVNSLYYACFYAVNALLFQSGRSSRRHSGVLHLFQRDFVRTGQVPIEFGRFYQLMFERRQAGDYRDLVWFEAAEVRPWIDQAREFVKRVTDLIEKPNPSSSTGLQSDK